MVALPNTSLIRVDRQSDHLLENRFPQWTPHLLSFAVPEPGDKRGEGHLATSILGCLQCPSAGVVLVDISRWAPDALSPEEPMNKLGSLIGTVKYIGQSRLELKAREELQEVPWHINSYVSQDSNYLADWSALQIVDSSLEEGETGLYRLRSTDRLLGMRDLHHLLVSAGAQVEQGRMSLPESLHEKWAPGLEGFKVTIPDNSILLWNEHYVAHNRSMLRTANNDGSRRIVQAMGIF